MCGICGIISFSEMTSYDELVVREMTTTLAHRGPDDEGFVFGKNHYFGHRRLSIIDLEHGKQPMTSACGRYSLVFNGEIYNYLELRQELSQSGYRFKTHSDAEVLLALLINRSELALDELNGMFAFAFFDSKKKEFLFARDHFGIKPFYYKFIENKIVFASEIKAILKHPEVRPELNHTALNEYFTFQFCLNSKTLFNGIKKLEPGYYAKGSLDDFRVYRYWDTEYEIDTHHTEDYFKDKLLYFLEDSIRLQVRSDVPLGAYLSGGLDSSVVSALASSYLGEGIDVFTGRFAESIDYDESPYAKILSSHIGAEYHQITPSASEFVDLLPDLIYSLDEPLAGPGVFPQQLVSKLASEKVKVLLGGQGGDELFGGYARYLIGYLEQSLKGAIFETQEEGQHIVTLGSIIENLPLLRQYGPLMKHFWQDGLFDPMDARYFRLINRSPDIQSFLTCDFLEAFDEAEVFNEFLKIFNHPDTKSYVNKMTHFDLKTLLPALLQVEDRVSMSVSVESRVPLLDKRIVQLVNSMPPHMKFKGGKTKYIFKQTVKNCIPKEIWNRKDKMGFPVPLKEWFSGGPVRDFVCDILLGKTSAERGIFNVDKIEALLLKEGTYGRQVWGALCLELWYRIFIDGK